MESGTCPECSAAMASECVARERAARKRRCARLMPAKIELTPLQGHQELASDANSHVHDKGEYVVCEKGYTAQNLFTQAEGQTTRAMCASWTTAIGYTPLGFYGATFSEDPEPLSPWGGNGWTKARQHGVDKCPWGGGDALRCWRPQGGRSWHTEEVTRRLLGSCSPRILNSYPSRFRCRPARRSL